MKVAKTPSCSPSFGIKIPNIIKEDILSETKKLYNRRTAKKLLSQIKSSGSDNISLGGFFLGFSKYGDDNIFIRLFLSDNGRSTLVYGSLGKYIRNKFPFLKMHNTLSDAQKFFV